MNLIGEHIDYEGYSVLPMAIGLDVIVAVSVALKEEGNVEEDEAEATLSIANVDGEKYTPKEFPFDHEQEVDVKSHHWTNYVLCRFKGIFDQLEKQNKLESVLESAFMKRVKKVMVMVDGKVPLGSGLSSSSALNCAVTVALMDSFELRFTKGELSELTCLSERYSGTQSGGMDQAISIMGEEDLAKITGQKPVITKFKKSVANFKTRKGSNAGLKVTLRKNKMYEFIDRLVNIALPRIKDFRGLSPKGFDKFGNYTFGIKEHIIFPEVSFDRADKVRGLDIVVVIKALNKDHAFALLEKMNFPFIKKGDN